MMTRRDIDCVDWLRNEEWYYIDYEHDRYVLTDKAPKEAQQSFEKWKKLNGVKWEEDK